MSIGRSVISTILGFSLVACGGGETPSSETASNSGSGGGGSTAADCSFTARAQFVRTTLEDWYLFPDKLNLSVNPASYSDLQSYIDALVAPSVTPPEGSGGPLQHAGLTFITSIAEENALITSGSSAGFGIRLSYNTGTNQVFVVEAFENAPAFAAGMDRGDELISINGSSVASLMASGGPQAVVDALGPSDPGTTRTLGWRTSGIDRSASIAKADYALDPVSDRYGAKILDDGVEQVGYINLRTFIVEDASDQLRTAMAQFKAQGITKIILDFRYNGGGLINVAATLGDLLGKDKVGQVFSKTMYRPSKSANDVTNYFQSEGNAIAATKIAVIGTEGTASASELVPNAFIPYLGTNLALVGSDTYGKPVGQSGFDRSACDDRLRAITFRTVNAAGGGDYYDGLASVMPVTCSAQDDFSKQLGDPSEASIKVALDFLAGRSCVAIAGSGARTAQSVTNRRRILRPEVPNAAQQDNPGLY